MQTTEAIIAELNRLYNSLQLSISKQDWASCEQLLTQCHSTFEMLFNKPDRQVLDYLEPLQGLKKSHHETLTAVIKVRDSLAAELKQNHRTQKIQQHYQQHAAAS